MTRDESLERLKDKLTAQEMRKVLTQGYSDVSLSIMANKGKVEARNMADSIFSVQSINKLCDAYADGVIDGQELDRIIDFSRFQKQNEKYLDDFLDSIEAGTGHITAARVFVALAYEECTYAKAMEMINAHVYYSTDQASLSVEDDIARELGKLGVPLRGCEGFNFTYDVDDVEWTIERKDAIFVKDYDLAVKVKEYMQLPDWEEFRDSVAEIIADYPDRNITGEQLDELRKGFVQTQYESRLLEKMKAEYDSFIAFVKTKPPDEIIASAYEIVTKKDIIEFCEFQSASLSEKQYNALLSSTNTLDEVYETWCTNSELHALYDIGLALEETADDIQYSIDRRLEEEKAKKQEPPAESKETSAPEEQQKPKHKAR